MASSIVTSATQQLGTLLVEEAKYLYEVSDKIRNLQSELEWMQCFLEDADNRQHQERVVRKWVAEIRDFAYEAEDLIERYVHEVSHPQLPEGIWNTIKWFSTILGGDALVLHDIGSSIDELSSKISKLNSRLQIYGIQIIKQTESSTYQFGLREQRRTYSHIEEKTVGLENHIKELVAKLTNENQVAKVVGICGIGGLGKTTLARKVYSDKKVKEHFKNCVWVYISKQFERRNVFEEILIGLSCSGSDDDARKKIKDLTNEELPQKICNILEEEECLVLLDDIWTKAAWDTLKPAFESIKRSRSKILITTRSLELAQYADPSGYSHPFGILSDEDGWKLLQQTAFMEEQNTAAEVKAKMVELGKEMLKHCGGLPLAIVALGGILATKSTIHDWEVVSKNMSLYLSDMVEGGGDTVLSVLELSYDDLPFYLKPCFMYLGCFPEDYEILTDRLYHLWEAEGLVTVSADERMENNGLRLDDIAESYLNQLVNRSMVQVEKRWPNGSIISCRLHDVMRDMCLKKCREVNFLKIAEGGNLEEISNCNTMCSSSMNTKLCRCVIHSKGEHRLFGDVSLFNVIHPYEAPYIRSLIVFADKGTRIDWEKALSLNLGKGFSPLRALDLEGLFSKDGAAMTYGIHLRYLRLRGFMGDIGVIGYNWDCKYLVTLDLQFELQYPISLSNELWKLERLRHLYLPSFFNVWPHGTLHFTLIQMRQLETLVNFDVKWCQTNDLEKMTNLRIFSFTSSGGWIENKDALVHLFKSPAITNGHLKSPLNLSIGARILEEDPTILTSPSLNSIFITELEIQGRFKKELALDKLGEHANKTDVKIFPRSLMKLYLTYWEIGKEDILELEKLPYLEELELEYTDTEGGKMSFSEGGFKKLLKLTLKNIRELEEWEVGEGALPNLLSLDVYNCPKLMRIPEGLPASMKLFCSPRGINGSEKYKQV